MGPVIDAHYRSNADRGAAQEELIGNVKLAAADGPLDDGQPQLARSQLHYALARDAFKHVS